MVLHERVYVTTRLSRDNSMNNEKMVFSIVMLLVHTTFTLLCDSYQQIESLETLPTDNSSESSFPRAIEGLLKDDPCISRFSSCISLLDPWYIAQHSLFFVTVISNRVSWKLF